MNTKEKMAKALWLASLSDCSQAQGKKQSIWYKDRFFERVDAVLEAMRVPGGEVCCAAVKAKVPPGAFTRGYQAMIDAIKEGK